MGKASTNSTSSRRRSYWSNAPVDGTSWLQQVVDHSSALDAQVVVDALGVLAWIQTNVLGDPARGDALVEWSLSLADAEHLAVSPWAWAARAHGLSAFTDRYVDTLPFRRFAAYTEKHPQTNTSAPVILVALLESIVNRIADVIERVGSDMDAVSAEVFNRNHLKGKRLPSHRDFRKLLERTGQSGELISKARESLASLSRLVAFVQQSTLPLPPEVRTRLRTLSKDVVAMSDHASFLGSNLNFILDATLGMINIDQNNILKIFSVATVVLLPPSVIGAIFGMNFEFIPFQHPRWQRLLGGRLPNPLPSNIAHWTSSDVKKRHKAAILLWMGGGVTHIDSFDPKPRLAATFSMPISAPSEKWAYPSPEGEEKIWQDGERQFRGEILLVPTNEPSR